jgi:hypothetical protein
MKRIAITHQEFMFSYQNLDIEIPSSSATWSYFTTTGHLDSISALYASRDFDLDLTLGSDPTIRSAF